jgi:hypothetical protein
MASSKDHTDISPDNILWPTVESLLGNEQQQYEDFTHQVKEKFLSQFKVDRDEKVVKRLRTLKCVFSNEFNLCSINLGHIWFEVLHSAFYHAIKMLSKSQSVSLFSVNSLLKGDVVDQPEGLLSVAISNLESWYVCLAGEVVVFCRALI